MIFRKILQTGRFSIHVVFSGRKNILFIMSSALPVDFLIMSITHDSKVLVYCLAFSVKYNRKSRLRNSDFLHDCSEMILFFREEPRKKRREIRKFLHVMHCQ